MDALAPRAGVRSVTDALVQLPESFDEDIALDDRDPGGEPPDSGARPGVAALWPSAENPVPRGARAMLVETSDGVTLRAALFGASGRTRGTILLLQGRNEAIEKYFETATDLARAGYATLTFDWRGQGGSERVLKDPMRGYVRTYRDYERDLDAIVERVLTVECRAPCTIVAHSMGALVALLAAPRLGGRIERMVLLAPLLALVNQPVSAATLRWGTGLLSLLGLGRVFAAMGPRPRAVPDFLSNVLTTDPERHERNGLIFVENHGIALGGPTVRWLFATMNAIARVMRPAHAAKVGVPSLMIAAGDDQVVSIAAMERMAARLRNANTLTVDGARHELLQERDRYREQVLAAILNYAAANDAEG